MKKNNSKKILFILIILVLLAGSIIFFIKRYSSNSEMIALKDIIGGKNLDADEAYIFYQDKYLVEDRGYIKEDKAYIPISTASKIDSRYYFQEGTDELLYTTANEVISFSRDSKVGNGKSSNIKFDYPPFIIENGISYISIDFINKYSGNEIGYYKDPNRIVILTNDYDIFSIKKDSYIRNLTGIKSYVIKKTDDEDVALLSKDVVEGWSKVITRDGYIGYVENIKIYGDSKKASEKIKDDYKYFDIDKDIKLGWHQVGSADGNITVNNLVGLEHINVISPTWFSIVDDNGNISDFSSAEYVQMMHNKGISVWILCDDFSTDIDLSKVLSNKDSRENLVNNLIKSTKEVEADGINIDFENIRETNALSYIQFLRELYIKSRENNLVISTDNYVPMEYNKHYLRSQQEQVIDYFIIMGYDEHTNGSKEAGSVSSYEFIKLGLENTLKEVPAKKIINALPFYTRLWKEEPNVSANGEVLKSEIITMKGQDKVIQDLDGEVKWDEDTKQNYMQVLKNGTTYKMWLEDKDSIDKKLELIRNYDISGIAFWKLGLENDDIWEVIK